MGLLVLIMLVFSATAFAAPNWIMVDKDEHGTLNYVDLNSISAYNGNPNIVKFLVMEKNPTNLYSMLMNIENNQWTYLEFASFAYPGEKIVGWEKQNLSWNKYDKEWPIPKTVLSNLNGKSSISSPQNNDGINDNGNLIYNGPLRGKGYEIINKETGVDTDVHKVVLSRITTGNASYDGDAWININTNNWRTIAIHVDSKFYRNDATPIDSYRTYQLRFDYAGGHTVTYPLPQTKKMLGEDAISVPGDIEVSLSGNTITAKLIVDGNTVSQMQVTDADVTSLRGKLTMMGAEGNLTIYK